MPRTAAALVIGNEILSGKIRDANTATLAETLRTIGIELRRVVVVPDEVDLIAAEVNTLRQRYDLLFTSGGVGPTHDDVTVESIARALGRRVVRSPEMAAQLRSYYGERCTDGHLRMADIVEGTELYPSRDAVWPTMVLGNMFVLPGVPEIFLLKLQGLLPRIDRGDAAFVLRNVYTSRDEGELKVHLDAVVARFDDVFVGSYPRWNDPRYSVRVTFDGRDAARVDAARDAFVAQLPEGAVVHIED
jgi:molybdenum cofactor synthesis domain-containing protein